MTANSPRSFWPPTFWAWILLILALGTTFWAWKQTLSSERQYAEARFDMEVSRTEQRILQRLDRLQKIPSEGLRLLRSGPRLDASMWKDFAQDVFDDLGNNGLQELTFLEPGTLPNADATPKLRARAPKSQADFQKFSWNLPAVQAALGDSRDTGVLRASSAFLCPGGTAKAVVILAPLYRYAAMPVSLKDRRRELKGWVGVLVRTDRLLDDLLQKNLLDVDLEIYEGSAPGAENLLFDRTGRALAAHPAANLPRNANRNIDVGGRTWNVWYFEKPVAVQVSGLPKDKIVLITGLLGSLFLFGIVWFLGSRKVSTEKLALQRDQKIRQAVEALPITVFSMDRTGRFVLVEGRGWNSPKLKPKNMQGRKASDLFAGYPGVQEIVQRALKGEAFSSPVEWDGETYEMQFVPMRNAEGGLEEVLGVAVNVSERKASEMRVRELLKHAERERDVLMKQNLLKGDFLAMVSHELRTPLTSIAGFLKLLDKESAGALNPEQKELTSTSLRNTERLSMLVNNLLDMNKLESGKAQLRVVSLSVDGILDEACSSVKDKAGYKNLKIDKRSPAEAVTFTGDHEMLLRTLINLLSNAVTHTPAGGQVEIGARSSSLDDHPVMEFWVKDTGPVIPEEELGRLFDKVHLSDKVAKGYGGETGLELALSKKVVELHGGRIWAETALESGCTFRFTLPVDSPGQPADKR